MNLIRMCISGVGALCLAFPVASASQQSKLITEDEVGSWLNTKYDCPADSSPHFWRFDLYDFKGDGNQEAVVVASTCETNTAGPDVHSVISRDSDGQLVEWKIPDAEPSTYDNLFGNRNYDLAVKDGVLVATFYDDMDRETPLVIRYKRNGEEFVIASIQKTGVFHTSYDCKKATEEVERAICHVQSLADLDVQLSASYKMLIRSLSAGERDKLRSEQRDWLVQRDRECAPYKGWVSCIADMYRDRIAEFEKRAAPSQTETLKKQ